MNFKRFGLGKQLINPSVATYGKYINANGTEQTSASGLGNHTDYISVTANRLYTVSYDKPPVSGNTIAISWYDNNKIFIKRDSEIMPFEMGRYKFTKTAPNNSAFAIVNFTWFSAYTETQNTHNYIFAIGESQLPYEPYGNTWTDVPHYIMGTSTDTITTLPVDVYADGNTATVGLKGNTVQSGTPTPDNPIIPQGTGERTGNLFDLSTATNEFINSNGSITPASANDPYYLSDYISADNVTISVQYKETAAAEIFTVGVYDSSKSFIRRDVISNNSVSYENVAYIRINYRDKNCQNVMLNSGSTPLPYEPYGYKIPISSANTTTPVYLGEVESTRRIRKLVLTGDESWGKNDTAISGVTIFTRTINDGLTGYTPFCTHYAGSNSTTWASLPTNFVTVSIVSGGVQRLAINVGAVYSEIIDFKSYLAAQYAAGTPVTVWYVLANEETAVVNEPLMKIGDYADTVSGVTVPMIIGKNTFDVETTLKPSEASLSYTGWHDAEVKEKSENCLDENDFGLVEVAAGTYRVGTDVGVLPSGKYTFNAVKSSSAVQIYRTTKNGSTYKYEAISELPYTFTADGVSNHIFRSAGNTGSSWADLGYYDVMLNTGETALTYEPYWK